MIYYFHCALCRGIYMKNEKLQQILNQARADIEAAQNSEDISNCRNKYLAKKMSYSNLRGQQ